jgi:hypothetical protein
LRAPDPMVKREEELVSYEEIKTWIRTYYFLEQETPD